MQKKITLALSSRSSSRKMTKLRCLGVEDEFPALQLLEHYALQVPFIEWMGGCRQPLDALPLLTSGQIDILFLDINLSQLDGISFYRSLVHKPQVIFTTAYAEYAVESYSIEALDYLVKPILFERFLQACNKAQRTFIQTDTTRSRRNVNQETLYIKSGSKWHQLQWEDISYLEKSENYIIFHTSNGRKILSRQNMVDVEQTMPVFFCRTHKSFIVNLKRVEVIEREKVTIQGQSIALADSYREAFIKRTGI